MSIVFKIFSLYIFKKFLFIVHIMLLTTNDQIWQQKYKALLTYPVLSAEPKNALSKGQSPHQEQ